VEEGDHGGGEAEELEGEGVSLGVDDDPGKALRAAVAGAGERLLLLRGEGVGEETVVGVERSEPLQGDPLVEIDAWVPPPEDPLSPRGQEEDDADAQAEEGGDGEG
jgi:hypothetical protein